jgi:hypothetical protein
VLIEVCYHQTNVGRGLDVQSTTLVVDCRKRYLRVMTSPEDKFPGIFSHGGAQYHVNKGFVGITDDNRQRR